MLKTNKEVCDYIWQSSKFDGDLLFSVISLAEKGDFYCATFLLLAILERICARADDDYNSSYKKILSSLLNKRVISETLHEYLNGSSDTKISIRCLRNKMVHEDLFSLIVLEHNDKKELFYPLSESDSIQPKPIEAKFQLVQRTHIMHRVLLRALIMVYESDKYGFLDDVAITGFFGYFDPSFGTTRRKDVVNFHMNRNEYVQTDFERVNVEALFSTRLKAKESTGLYTKNAEELSDIYTVKGKTTSNTKTKK